MKITKFDANVCSDFQKKVIKALKQLCDEHGVEITPGSGSYSSLSYNMKLVVSVGSRNEAEEKQFETDWKLYFAHDTTNLHLGQKFTHRRKSYTIIGYKPSSKYNVATRDENGETVFFKYGILNQAAEGSKNKNFTIN